MAPSLPVLVVLGMMGRTPVAGVGWQVLHYLEGFRRLGYDVYYLEDTGDWPYDPDRNTISSDPSYAVSYIDGLMHWCGLPDKWAYTAASQEGRSYGLASHQVAEILSRADVLVNVTGATVLREQHLRTPIRIFLETDPTLAQIEVAMGNQATIDLLAAHTHLFTYAENLGSLDCALPVGPLPYYPTRPPVILDWWNATPEVEGTRDDFTTISAWKQSGKDITWNGQTYVWSKHLQFLQFMDLPRQVDCPLEVALSSSDPEVITLWESHGWRIVDGLRLSKDVHSYRNYIRASHGEFTVAKDQYVRPRTGWFSDRSACYLAAGKPVVTQDTGFGTFIPTGMGLFPFSTMTDIKRALTTIESDYAHHSAGAREVAEQYFKAELVLARMLQDCGIAPRV